MTLRRFGSIAGALFLGAVAGIASYSHLRHVALVNGQGPFVSALLALTPDVLVLVGALSIGDGRRHTGTAWFAFLLGVGASLAGNVAAARPETGPRLVSAWASIAFLVAGELVIRGGRASAAVVAPVEQPIAPVTLGNPLYATESAELASPVVTATPETAKPRAPRRDSKAEPVRKAAARMPGATKAQIAAKAGVGESTARRHLRDDPAPAKPVAVERVNGHNPLEGVTSR